MRNSSTLRIVALLAAPLFLCAAEPPATRGLTPTGIAPPTRIPNPEVVTPGPAGEPVSSAEMPRAVRRAVVADAAKRFRVAESAVVLVRAERVTWPDGSLGCHEPGRMYTQMLVPGFRVTAKTSAGELTYHTDMRGNAVSCGGAPVGRAPEARGEAGATPRAEPPPRVPDR